MLLLIEVKKNHSKKLTRFYINANVKLKLTHVWSMRELAVAQ